MKTPAWDIESEYPSLDSKEFAADFSAVTDGIARMEATIAKLDFSKPSPALVPGIQTLLDDHQKTTTIAYNLATYCNCLKSVDATDKDARKKAADVEKTFSQLGQTLAPLFNFLVDCDIEIFDALFEKKEIKGEEFHLRRARELAPFKLSTAEEVLLTAMQTDGHRAWGVLRESLAGTGKAKIQFPDKVETVGLAQAATYVFGSDPVAREAAWKAIREYWTEHRETSAAVLNALSGWRLEVYKKRSTKKERHYLDDPCFKNRITRDTLEALMESCRTNLTQLRRAPQLMAKTMGREKMHPWDLAAASPIRGETKEIPFDEGLDLVARTLSSVDPSMGEFVRMMGDRRWIEGRILPNKGAGAYCTGFAKSRTPRIFQSYSGSLSDVMTLAHELGHAYHSWVMRDLPRAETYYPMTLAETASVFCENVMSDALLSRAKTWEEKIEFGWNDIEGVSGFLVGIPMRFQVERGLYERRKSSIVTADELCEITDEAYAAWYGPTVTENDTMFWAKNMHISMSYTSFYNFPYTFGYLFSLSLYARRADYGANFITKYNELLRDTGRMTAEDLVKKHLGEDIRLPEFWQKAIDVAVAKLDSYEKTLAQR